MLKKFWFKLFPPKLSAKKAIKILEPIPEEKWTTGVLEKFSTGQRCALGHLAFHFTGNPEGESPIMNQFMVKARNFLKEEHRFYGSIADVNDGNDVNGYTEAHPKKRVVHLLKDMQKAGY